MHTLLWILLFVYAVFSLRWSVRQVKNAFYNNGKEDPKWFTFVLAVVAIFVLSPFLHVVHVFVRVFVGPILDLRKRWKVEEQHRQEQERETARKKRVDEWLAANPPVLYHNTIEGVTAVVRKDKYEEAVRQHQRDIRDGLVVKVKPLVIYETYLFCHASAKSVPDDHKTGRLSDFDDLAKVAKVERRGEIFVPFANDSVVPLHLQRGLVFNWSAEHHAEHPLPDGAANIWGASDRAADYSRRLLMIRPYLLRVDVPWEVRIGTVEPAVSAK
ncbi:MAG: hypothetical protein Q8R08_04070 [bacterium]|nr:hypothetical protein [bacterium]